MKENETKLTDFSYVTPLNFRQEVEHQENRTSLARRGQSLKPADLVRRLREGGQVPELNSYENYNDSEFSDTDFDDCGTLFRIDPLEYVDQAREKLEYVQKNAKNKEDKMDEVRKHQKVDQPSTAADSSSNSGPDAASV